MSTEPQRTCPSCGNGFSVDIRSDLYSLGVTLWVMLTGQTPFRGPSAEVMYQHQPRRLVGALAGKGTSPSCFAHYGFRC